MAQVTTLWPYGGPGHLHGSFAGKVESEGGVSNLMMMGIGSIVWFLATLGQLYHMYTPGER